MIEVGSRWYFGGRHYTVVERKVQRNRDGALVPQVLIVPDGRKKAKPLDWVDEWRIEKHGKPSGA